jgi:WD40 repeat protein
MSDHPKRDAFAFAWTVDGNNVRIRSRAHADKELKNTPLDAGAAPLALAFSPAGDFLAAGTESGIVRIWTVGEDGADATFALLKDLALGDAHGVMSLAIWTSDDGLTVKLAAITSRRVLKIWTLANTAEAITPVAIPALKDAPTNADRTDRLAWSPDGNSLAVATQEGPVIVIRP